MHKLTLEWQESNQKKTETIVDQQYSKNPGTVRLGRDRTRCDVVLTHPTVSGLHVEIFFNYSTYCFALRNLRHTNPPLVDGQQIIQGEVPIKEGSVIYLGQVALKVVALSVAAPTNQGIPPTILIPPPTPTPTTQPNSNAVSYGLQCPTCGRISPYEQLNFGCQWCGTSLAAAASILITPNGEEN